MRAALVFGPDRKYLPAFRARSSAVEHLTFNQVVVGSIPTGLTRNSKGLTEKQSEPKLHR